MWGSGEVGKMSEGAKKLGEKLLAEVKVEDLSSVLKSLRELHLKRNQSNNSHTTTSNPFFGIPELDALLPDHTPPILELVSPPLAHHPSGAGKTSLLYLIIAQAILPALFSSSIALGGQDAAIILFDPMNQFNVARLAEVMLRLLKSALGAAGGELELSATSEIKVLIKRSLMHVHILHPQSWPSLLATLRCLPDYLFNEERRRGMHRRVHSIILKDVDAFIWPMRNLSHSSSSTSTSNPLSGASARLTTQLQKLATLLSCATILSSHSVSPCAFRPPLPNSWSQGTSVTRLAFRRIEVLKFALAISIEEAEVERQQRWDVVSRGRFECWKVGTGNRDGEGFVFRVGEGVEVEKPEL